MKRAIKAEGSTSGKKAKVVANPFIFHWTVNGSGYQWAKGIVGGEARLVGRVGQGKALTKSFSLERAFERFATIDPTPGSIQDFANEYGELFRVSDLTNHAAHDGISSGGATLRDWQNEAWDMRVLFDLWMDIRKRRRQSLKNVVSWETKGGHSFVSYQLNFSRRKTTKVLGHTHSAAENWWGSKNFRRGDLVLPARCALQTELNARLEMYPTCPQLNWTPDSLDTTGGHHQRIIFRPPHLLGAMWLRFAQAVAEDLAVQRCACGCGKYFQVGSGSGRRADCEYYEDVCRVRAWVAKNARTSKG